MRTTVRLGNIVRSYSSTQTIFREKVSKGGVHHSMEDTTGRKLDSVTIQD